MKITKAGIWFDYEGDELLWLWWWKRGRLPNGKTGKYVSLLCDGVFESLKEYWIFWGEYAQACRQDKVYGYTEAEVFNDWASWSFMRNIVVVLKNINYELKPNYFWASIAPRQRKELKKDVVVLFFNHYDEAKRIFDSIHAEFADAYLYKNGKIQATNNEIILKPRQDLSNSSEF